MYNNLTEVLHDPLLVVVVHVVVPCHHGGPGQSLQAALLLVLVILNKEGRAGVLVHHSLWPLGIG